MHSFDIQRDDTVLDAWRELDKRTHDEGAMAKDVFFGKKKGLPKGTQDDKPRNDAKPSKTLKWEEIADFRPVKVTPPAVAPGSSRDHDLAKVLRIERQLRTLSTAEKQKPGAQAKDVQFGRPSPPRSSLRNTKQGEENSASHASRWASYGDLPASFSQATTPEALARAETNDEKLPVASKNVPRSAFDIMADAAAEQHVRSSTMQVSSTSKQSKEHQPLLEMFWKQNAQRKGIETKPTGIDYHPILDLYETQLQQLSASSHQKSSAPAFEAGPSASQAEAAPKTGISQANSETIRLQTPGELLTLSIQSLLHGVGQLASAFKLTNSELQHQIEVAQKDIPRNIEKALKSSLNTLDSLRCSLPQAKASPPSPQANKGTQAERSATSDQATNTATPLEKAFLKAKDDTIAALDSASAKLASAQPAEKEALHQVASLEQEETKRQNDRVDRVVESMRVELLNSGWKPDSRVYTRADLLEEFLATFISLRATAETKEEVPQAASSFISPMSVASAELSAPAAPPVPLKVKDDDLPSLEKPYSWDMDYSAPKPANASKSEAVDLLTPSFEQWQPKIPLPCPQCHLTFSTRGDLTWHVEQHDKQHDLQERKAYKFPTRAPMDVEWKPLPQFDDEWKPLTPQLAQPFTYQPWVFSPANVMEAKPTTYPPIHPPYTEAPKYEDFAQTKPHETHTSQQPVAELADDKVLEKYPTISQLEDRRQTQKLKSHRTDNRTSTHVSFMEPMRARDTSQQNAYELDRLLPAKGSSKRSSMLDNLRDRQQQRLSSRMSMPVMKSSKPEASSTGAAPLYQDFPFQTASSAKPTSALHKSASTSFKPARPYETTINVQRSNTTAGPSAKEQTKRPSAYKPYEPAKYRPATPGPVEQAAIKVEDCKARLVEFGFDAMHAANVSKLVKGDLEEAIDILEEDASVRKAWKGKGRAHGERRRHVPGAFDDEIYG